MTDDPVHPRDGRPTPRASGNRSALARRALLGTLAAGASGLAGCSSFDSPSPPIQSRVDSPGWPLAGHDTHQTGHNPAATGVPDDPTERWRVDFDLGGTTGALPAVVGDRVYLGGRRLTAHRRSDGAVVWEHDVGETLAATVTDGDALYAPAWPDDDGPVDSASLYAFDRDDGHRRWRVGGDWPYVGRPVVAGDAVYAPVSSTFTAVGTDGEVRWRRSVPPNIVTVAPAVTDDAVYHLADGRRVGCYRRTPGVVAGAIGGRPGLRWTGEESWGVTAAPAVADGRTFAGASITFYPDEPRNDARLRCYDADGTVQWSRVIGARSASPAVADGVVYALTGVHREIVDRGSHVQMRRDGVLRAFDAATGQPRWSRTYEGAGNSLADPVVADGVCYAALHDRIDGESSLVAVGVDGTERWRRSLSSRAYHLAVVDGTLLATLSEGTVVAFE